MRLAPLNRVWMMLSVWGTIAAAPTPCRTRAATKAPVVGAMPHSRDANVKVTRPVMNSRRDPSSAPSRAPVISSMAYATV